MPSVIRHARPCVSAGFVLLAACLLTAPASHSSPVLRPKPTVGARVNVMDNYFDPRSVTIEKGEAVKWAWKGDGRHNVVFSKVPEGATKKNLRARTNGSVSRTLGPVGTYHYACSLYDGMEATVTVTDH